MSAATCALCPHRCQLGDGQTGLCRARGNVGGKVVSLNYGLVSSLALDPVEKKPLARWRSGKTILSVGSFGCNLRCPFCQNCEISQAGAEAARCKLTPSELVSLAEQCLGRGNVGVAFTYNEPLIGYEFVRDAATLLHERGLAAVLVSNGMINPEPFSELLPLIDAANIDLKGWRPEFYAWLGGDLDVVKANLASAIRSGCHVEVTTLILDGRNDSEADMDAEAAWLASLSPDVPLHLSRAFPRYRMPGLRPTPRDTIDRLHAVAARHLRFVFNGNY